MKSIFAALVVVFAAQMSFAQAPEAQPEGSAPAVEAPAHKMTKKEAKAACKSEGKKHKALKECIKEKTM